MSRSSEYFFLIETLEDVERGTGPSAILDPKTGYVYELDESDTITTDAEVREP